MGEKMLQGKTKEKLMNFKNEWDGNIVKIHVRAQENPTT